MSYEYRQRIGDRWCDALGGGTWNVVNPATEETVRTVPFGAGEDCLAAIEAASAAFPSWSNQTANRGPLISERAASLIRERAAKLAVTTVFESGKPLLQARGEWMVAADLFEWFAEEGKRAYGRWVPARGASKRQLVLRQPLGVVGLITAWKFPAYNPARAAAAALAAGCTLVIRSSEYTPLTAMEMVNVLVEAGLPPGTLNLINGDPKPWAADARQSAVCKDSLHRQPACGQIADGRSFENSNQAVSGVRR